MGRFCSSSICTRRPSLVSSSLSCPLNGRRPGEESIAASTRLFEAPGPTRRGLLGRLAWTDPAGTGWSASLDLVRMIEDGGWSATGALGWEADRLRLDAGARIFGGKPDSAYRLLPERSVAFIGARFAF